MRPARCAEDEDEDEDECKACGGRGSNAAENDEGTAGDDASEAVLRARLALRWVELCLFVRELLPDFGRVDGSGVVLRWGFE